MLRRSFLSLFVPGLSTTAVIHANAASPEDAALREKIGAALEKGRAFLRQQQ